MSWKAIALLLMLLSALAVAGAAGFTVWALTRKPLPAGQDPLWRGMPLPDRTAHPAPGPVKG